LQSHEEPFTSRETANEENGLRFIQLSGIGEGEDLTLIVLVAAWRCSSIASIIAAADGSNNVATSDLRGNENISIDRQ
jgi:hypothetical protein